MVKQLRWIVPLLVLGSWCTGPAWADYVDPPPWQTNPYYTHQSWDFNTSDNPIAPDGGYSNPYGTPQVQVINGTWMSSSPYYPYGDRSGWWIFQGPHTKDDLLATITIPNTEHPELIKEIWFQATLQTNMMNLQEDLEISLLPNGQGPPLFAGSNVDIEILDPNIGLVRATLRFTIPEQPEFEVFELRADMDSGDFFAVDQLDIDTRCVGIPEPASVVLGLLAAPALLLFWRRNK